MRFFGYSLSMIALLALVSCATTEKTCGEKYPNLEVTGSLEITHYSTEKSSNQQCSIRGRMVDDNGEPLIGMTAHLQNTTIGTTADIDGNFELQTIPPGSYILTFRYVGSESATIKIDLTEGDEVKIEGVLSPFGEVLLKKPIIYLYPEKETEVNVQLEYDGKLTTTYPTYPSSGWTVTAQPDGTLFDENEKEYYALYWEGKPYSPLQITDGFVVSKEETISFLEEKLADLGLNAKESNEFIIFWLPILENNKFNLIHFAGEDYLEQAKLTISPQPETMIRIAMVFQGLEKPIDVPVQDLSPLKKIRTGFTLVEWGGQELPKEKNKEL